MIKFFQFIKWCGRKFWANSSSSALAVPRALYKFFTYLKAELREYPVLTICIWWLVSFGITVCTICGVLIYRTNTGSTLSLDYAVRIEIYISFTLLIITGICSIYDVFEEEQQEIINRLKK